MRLSIAILFITEAKLWICNCFLVDFFTLASSNTIGTYFRIWIFPWVETSGTSENSAQSILLCKWNIYLFQPKNKDPKRNETKWIEIDSVRSKWKMMIMKEHAKINFVNCIKILRRQSSSTHSIWHSKNEQNKRRKKKKKKNKQTLKQTTQLATKDERQHDTINSMSW